MSETPRDAARRQAEEALETVALRYPNGLGSYYTLSICTSAPRALLDATAPVSGSVSTVRSDDPPAKPLPTCCNCGSNLITPAPASDAVAEAAERCANDGCGCVRSEPDPDGIGVRILWCPDRWPGDTEQWCWSCQMRAAFDARRRG